MFACSVLMATMLFIGQTEVSTSLVCALPIIDLVSNRLLIRARADRVLDFAEELDDATCPVCEERS